MTAPLLERLRTLRAETASLLAGNDTPAAAALRRQLDAVVCAALPDLAVDIFAGDRERMIAGATSLRQFCGDDLARFEAMHADLCAGRACRAEHCLIERSAS